jgi:hypothetical protein
MVVTPLQGDKSVPLWITGGVCQSLVDRKPASQLPENGWVDTQTQFLFCSRPVELAPKRADAKIPLNFARFQAGNAFFCRHPIPSV